MTYSPALDKSAFKLHGSDAEFLDTAREFGKNWYEGGVTVSQIRRFYGEIKRLEQLISKEPETTESRWELDFRLLKAKAGYASAPGKPSRTPEHLTNFVKWGTEQVKGGREFKSSFERFAKYFEAAVGYAYDYGVAKTKGGLH